MQRAPPGLTRINPLGLSGSGAERRIGVEIMKRLRKRPIAWMAIVGVLFAQLAMAAYGFDNTASHTSVVDAAIGAGVGAGGGHCAGPSSEPVPANVCEVHCTDGASSPPAPDLPPVSLTALPVDLVPFAASAREREHVGALPAPLPGAPPPTLRFCRLLI